MAKAHFLSRATKTLKPQTAIIFISVSANFSKRNNMITSNIHLGKEISIEKDASINNVSIGDFTKIASGVRIFGSPENVLEVGTGCYFGLNSIVEGFNA